MRREGLNTQGVARRQPAIVVAGTDTGVGKTVFSAALANALGAAYWKPVQSGLEGETDREVVARLGKIPGERLIAEAYRLKTPAAPEHAAEVEAIHIDQRRLLPPTTQTPLVIETAGGLFVPMAPGLLQIDIVERWKLPVILVASTRLGTINHCLLSLEALRKRSIDVLGVAFVGHESAYAQDAVARFGRVPVLGRLPFLDQLNPQSLAKAFIGSFDVARFACDCQRAS